jgi:hypothetical protein
MGPERHQRRRFQLSGRRSAAILAVLLLACGAVALSVATSLTPHLRRQVEEALADRFDSQVELKSFRVSVFPHVGIHGESLVLRHKGRTDVPPLISIKAFSAGAGLWGLLRKPLRIHEARLEGLEIQVPPGGLEPDDEEDDREDRLREKAALEAARNVADKGTNPPAALPAPEANQRSPLIVDRLVSREARLVLLRGTPGKTSRVFEIYDLVMTEIGLDRAATFEASLSNPKPVGLIKAGGEFGPWDKRHPRRTPLRAGYRFEKANLDTIDGISGTLSSTGKFWGVLERIDVEGETDTPDFSVDEAGGPVHLRTRFKAVVDGTSGNTWLNPVEARFLDSIVIARGGVIQRDEPDGASIELDVSIGDARIEDVLKLAVKAKTPPIRGGLQAKTRFILPPGEKDVPNRLRLAGSFALSDARFSSFDVQEQIATLSQRGRGETTGKVNGGSVLSDFDGRFVMRDAVMSFPSLRFSVPGAEVRLAGTYLLEPEVLDFEGDLLLAVPLSKTTSGVKAFVLKMVDPFFKNKAGGARLPIKVTGTREKPSFKLDVKEALLPGN